MRIGLAMMQVQNTKSYPFGIIIRSPTETFNGFLVPSYMYQKVTIQLSAVLIAKRQTTVRIGFAVCRLSGIYTTVGEAWRLYLL